MRLTLDFGKSLHAFMDEFGALVIEDDGDPYVPATSSITFMADDLSLLKVYKVLNRHLTTIGFVGSDEEDHGDWENEPEPFPIETEDPATEVAYEDWLVESFFEYDPA